MPSYSVKQARDQSLQIQGKDNNEKVSYDATFFVDVGGSAPAGVSPYAVATATGLPKVNKSAYSIGGQILPFCICRSVTASPLPNAINRWVVKAKYEPVTPAMPTPMGSITALTDILPVVTSDLGEIEKVLYVDKNSVAPKPCSITPTGNFWSEPIVEKIPTLTLKISQYESSIAFQSMLDRKFKMNSGSYRGQVKHKWLVTDVEATDVEIELVSGTANAALVTYSVALSPHDYGWNESRALIDTQYLAAGKKTLFVNDIPGASSIGFINADGSKRAQQDPTIAPDHIEYQVYDEASFGFLQV